MKSNLSKPLEAQDLAGKNTMQVAHFLAEEFVNRFGEDWGTKTEVAKKLLPRGRASSWGTLDRNITTFCKQFYTTWQTDTDKVKFFDEVRFVLEALPQKLDYKPVEHKAEYGTREDMAEHFVFCSLCWRSVARKPLEK
ncbi:MAG: hypothetical protein LBJ14_08115, partial [Desulfarculales bacterium]|nr:hypothetical protein [Desulfarculales bacterium]